MFNKNLTKNIRTYQEVHFLLASSNVPTNSGTSSSSSASYFLPSRLPSYVFKNWYYYGPTCLRISGIMSFRFLVSGVPATTRRFSLTEKEVYGLLK